MAEVETQKDLDFERKHEEDLRRIRDFRLMDDNFMSKVFEDKPCAEFLLRIILNRDDLKVKEVHGQHDLNNIQGRSVRLDILAVDHKNRAYNVEVQRSDSGAVAKRARYNSSLLDANLTRKGDAYDALNETYVIFITENDVLRGGLILADEPTGNLDSKTSSDVLGLLKVTSQKFHQTIVMITHNSEIAQLADRIVRIEDGKIAE